MILYLWVQMKKSQRKRLTMSLNQIDATNALWVKPCRKPEIKKNTPRLPFFGDSYISDRNIWNQFHFCLIFGYELKPISAAVEFSQESVGIPAGLLKDVKKWEDQLKRLLNKKPQIFLMIQLRKSIWEIFAQRTAARRFFLFSSFFLSTISLLNTPNFRILRPAVHVFCK